MDTFTKFTFYVFFPPDIILFYLANERLWVWAPVGSNLRADSAYCPCLRGTFFSFLSHSGPLMHLRTSITDSAHFISHGYFVDGIIQRMDHYTTCYKWYILRYEHPSRTAEWSNNSTLYQPIPFVGVLPRQTRSGSAPQVHLCTCGVLPERVCMGSAPLNGIYRCTCVAFCQCSKSISYQLCCIRSFKHSI